MRTLKSLMPRAPCVTILHHNRLYRSSDYISNYIGYLYIEPRGSTFFVIRLVSDDDYVFFQCMATLNKMLEPGLKTQPHLVQSH